jgi:hypothetical protein
VDDRSCPQRHLLGAAGDHVPKPRADVAYAHMLNKGVLVRLNSVARLCRGLGTQENWPRVPRGLRGSRQDLHSTRAEALWPWLNDDARTGIIAPNLKSRFHRLSSYSLYRRRSVALQHRFESSCTIQMSIPHSCKPLLPPGIASKRGAALTAASHNSWGQAGKGKTSRN